MTKLNYQVVKTTARTLKIWIDETMSGGTMAPRDIKHV